MKKTLALFKSIEYGFIGAHENRWEDNEDYVRMTDYVEVYFPERELQDQIKDQISALDKAAEEIIEKYLEGLESIKQRKAELLSLTVQS